jgi:uncharacterized membrane protein
VVEKVTPDKVIQALSRYGGTVLKTSLSRELEEEIQQALHGASTGATSSGAGAGTQTPQPASRV